MKKKPIDRMWGDLHITFRKAWDLVHGYGYHVHIVDYKSWRVGYGFSKNKFTAVKMALTFKF